jgi:hypothetical protein
MIPDVASTHITNAYYDAYHSFNNLAFPHRIASLVGSKANLAKASIASHPISFVLPMQASEFLVHFYQSEFLWLYKPAKETGGNGIVIFRDEATAIRLVERAVKDDVMQQYIQSILVNDCKVDMRVYVLVTRRQEFGLCAYMYKQGFMRSCIKKYDGNSTDLLCHLTNVSFAKRNKLQQRVYDLSHEEIRNRFEWDKVKKSILQSLESVFEHDQRIPSSCQCYLCKRGCVQLFGYDILVDDMKRAWILEANIHPKLRFEERSIDRSLFRDIIKILVGEESWDNESFGSFAYHIGKDELWFDGAFDGKPDFDRLM